VVALDSSARSRCAVVWMVFLSGIPVDCGGRFSAGVGLASEGWAVIDLVDVFRVESRVIGVTASGAGGPP